MGAMTTAAPTSGPLTKLVKPSRAKKVRIGQGRDPGVLAFLCARGDRNFPGRGGLGVFQE